MKHIRALFICSASLIAFAAPASAQDASSDAGAQTASGADIVVTARRRDESLQDVPLTVNAVSNATIEKLNLLNFKDIQSIVPGLSLTGGLTGADANFALRGVSFSTLAQNSSPSVQFYMNEAPLNVNQVFQSMYDVGQIEVLRGPQGTLRGKSAPSGAITLTTRKPNLNEWGGYVNFTGTARGNINAQGAVGIPLIEDVLAVRFAGSIDHNDLDGIRSINNGTSPFSRSESGRVSVLFEPTDNIDVAVMYQHMSVRNLSFRSVIGFSDPFDQPVFPGFSINLPAGGPTIAPGQRLAVVEGGVSGSQKFNLVTGNLNWKFAGQKLSYVGSYNTTHPRTVEGLDIYNTFPGFEGYQDFDTRGWQHTHELRLASDERIAGIFDYTVGAFVDRVYSDVSGQLNPTSPYLPITTTLALDIQAAETSFFGSGTIHVSDRTELTAGARHINYKFSQPGPYGLPGQGNSICISGAANFCLPNTSVNPPIVENAWVWNASLSHRFSDNFLAYANAGTSYRAGFQLVAFAALDATNPSTGLPFTSSNDLRSKPSEKSTGYEVGIKSNFLDDRIRLNVAGFYQKFKNNSFYVNNIPYYDVTGNQLATGSFTATADAVVWGVDVDAALQITPSWNVTAGFAWADGHVDNDEVPCRDGNFDGIEDTGSPTIAGFQAANAIVARCRSNQSISTAPRWSLTLQSEYSHPVSDHADGFVRGLFTYYPDNPNDNRNIVIDNYGLLNLYAGIRSPDNGWEVSLFAKNLTNTQTIVSYGDAPFPADINFLAAGRYSVPVNYRTVNYTSRREFGLNVRYAFGSR